MADTLFKGNFQTPLLEQWWPFCTVDTKHVAVEAIDSCRSFSNPIPVVLFYSTAPRARKSPRQDDYEVNIVYAKCYWIVSKPQNEVSLLATKELLCWLCFFFFNVFSSLHHLPFLSKGLGPLKISFYFASLYWTMKTMKCWGMRYCAIFLKNLMQHY